MLTEFVIVRFAILWLTRKTILTNVTLYALKYIYTVTAERFNRNPSLADLRGGRTTLQYNTTRVQGV